jgi:hypothetical protein
MNDKINYEAFHLNEWEIEEFLRSKGYLKDHKVGIYYIYLNNSEKWSRRGGERVVQVFISLKTRDLVAMAQLDSENRENREKLREILIMKEIREKKIDFIW